jgi:hypothetical protein
MGSSGATPERPASGRKESLLPLDDAKAKTLRRKPVIIPAHHRARVAARSRQEHLQIGLSLEPF